MEQVSKAADGWTPCEFDIIEAMYSGLIHRNLALVVETGLADDGTPVTSFCSADTGEAFYWVTKIDGVYVFGNVCGSVIEGSDLYRVMSSMLVPKGWVQAVQRVNKR